MSTTGAPALPASLPSSSAIDESLPSAISIDEIRFADTVARGQANPIALAPLRWNLVKCTLAWDTQIRDAITLGTSEKTGMIMDHKKKVSS
jgi:hypothetical protein